MTGPKAAFAWLLVVALAACSQPTGLGQEGPTRVEATPSSPPSVINPTSAPRATNTSHPSPTPPPIELSPITLDNAANLRLIASIDFFQGSPYEGSASLSISPDGNLVMASPPGGTLASVALHWLAPGLLVPPASPATPHPLHSGVTDLTFSPDGTRLAVAFVGEEGEVRLLDPLTVDVIASLAPVEYPRSLAFTEGGRSLAIASYGWPTGQVELWDVPTATRIQVLSRELSWGPPCSVATSPDDTILAAGYCLNANNFAAWDVVNDYAPFGLITGIDGAADCAHFCDTERNAIEFSPDNKSIASGTIWPRVPIISLPSGRLQFVIDTSRALDEASYTQPSPVYGLAFNHDGALLAIAAANELQVRDTSDGAFLFHHERPHDAHTTFTAVAFAPDGSLLLSIDSHGQLDLWGVPAP